MAADTRSERDASVKVRKFKGRIIEDARWGPDAGLFFAAEAAIRKARNMGSHQLANIPPPNLQDRVDKMDAVIAEFDKLAEKHGFPLRPPRFASPGEEHIHAPQKWLTSLTQVAVTWVAAYSRLPAKS